MSSTKWTSAQQSAIDDRGGALLVSAAAGSGKTAVLTERVLKLLSDTQRPIQAERLLIVTFTNAAAAELRARIAARIEEELLKTPANMQLRRQKMRLARAHICTIDAYCLDLLRRHFTALNIPPDFSTADAGIVETLKSAALSETLEKMVQNSDFCNFADLYGRGRNDYISEQSILQLHGFLSAMPFPEERLLEILNIWQNSFNASPWKILLIERLKALAKGGARLSSEARRFSEEDLCEQRILAAEKKKTESAKAKEVQKVNEKFATVHERLQELEEIFLLALELLNTENGWDKLYNTFEPYRQDKANIPGIKGKNMRLSGENKKIVKASADKAGTLLEDMLYLLACSEADAEADRQKALPMIKALLDATKLFSDIFYQKKLEKKVLEFSDFEQLALKLLSATDGEAALVAQSICSEFDAVMVDEYQDTNALQDAIYSLLGGENGEKLFYVGDLKQSIYRFRQADPFIFASKQENFSPINAGNARPYPTEGQTAESAIIALDANFRSAPAVISGVNFLFNLLMNQNLGGTEYGDGQRLVCGVDSDYIGETGLLIDTDKENDAQQIAKKIDELVALGQSGDERGFIRTKTGTRAIRHEDCCILLATRTSFSDYQVALEAKGMAVYADSSEDLLASAHIRPIVAFLQVIDNPSQDIPLCAVMLSPLFGFTEDDLVALRLRQKKGSLYGAIATIANETRKALVEIEHAQNNNSTREFNENDFIETTPQQSAKNQPSHEENLNSFSLKILDFYEKLADLRRLSHSIPPSELLEQIFASTHYHALVGVMENGYKRREDLSRFADFISSMGVNGIEALVRSLAALSASGGLKDTNPGGARPGCVTIMTIHRSKGLQFPVVFVAQCQHLFNMDDIKGKILLHRTSGLGLQLRGDNGGNNYPTLAHIAIKEQLQEEMRSEQMRLLYVALTRAQDKLFITLSANSHKNICDKLSEMMASHVSKTAFLAHKNMRSFADWVLSALLLHPNGGKLRELSGNINLITPDEKGCFNIEFYEPLETKEQNSDVEHGITAQPDEELTQKLLTNFAWQYPQKALTKTPAKVSVTGIVHKSQNTILSRPSFIAKEGLSAAERGTAMHAFLQHVDFAKIVKAKQQGTAELINAITIEKMRQQAEQLLPETWVEQLDDINLKRFFEGEVFERICGASKVMREYDFITGLPAEVLFDENTNELPKTSKVKNATVLVQGIADILLVYDDHLELLDYKSDKGKSEEVFRTHYKRQLEIYADAISKRFTPKKVTYMGIYSLELGKLIKV